MKEHFGSKTAYLIDRYNALIEVAGPALARAYRHDILLLRSDVIGGAEFAKMYRDAYKDCQTSGLGWMPEWHPENVLGPKPRLTDVMKAANEIDRTINVPSHTHNKVVNAGLYETVNVVEEDVCDNPYLLLG